MAGGLPPPPTRAESGDFLWVDWYNKLNNLLNTGGVVAWTSINFSGSSISDIQSRDHSQLTGLQGGTAGEYYHLTAAQAAGIGVGNHNDLLAIQGGNSSERYHFTNSEHGSLQTILGSTLVNTFNTRSGTVTLTLTDVTTALTYTPVSPVYLTKSSDPTTTDITSGRFAMYKNTTLGTLKLWANDGGTLKSITLI